MTSIKDLLEEIPESDSETSGDEVMQDPEYLRKSSALISEALQKGFDVVQLDNGDVISTGTKVVVTRYRWDPKEEKMIRLTEKEKKASEKKSTKSAS